MLLLSIDLVSIGLIVGEERRRVVPTPLITTNNVAESRLAEGNAVVSRKLRETSLCASIAFRFSPFSVVIVTLP